MKEGEAKGSNVSNSKSLLRTLRVFEGCKLV